MQQYNNKTISFLWLTLITVFLVFITGCEEKPSQKKESTVITAWFHTGRPEEKRVIENQVNRFNKSQNNITIQLTLIPEGDYNTQIQSAAADGKLPDLLDLDGPYLANYAWKGHLIPMDDLIGENLKEDLLPSIITQGTYQNRLYAVGTFDSGLGLYANKRILAEAGIELPSLKYTAWSVDTFEKHLKKLSKMDNDGMVLDLRLDYRGEWYTFAFSPVIQSAGGDLIDRTTYQTAHNILNGSETIKAMLRMQQWFQNDYVDPNIDSSSFINGKVAFSWCGHWEYPRYKKALGDNLILLPLPDFGRGSKTGMGSWCWAITKNCKHPEKAIQFIKFLLQTPEILAMCKANGAVPATTKAIAASSLYREDGPLHPFVQGLKNAIPRPRTPGYPVITSAFQQAFQDIRHGVDVKKALDNAVEVIDQDIKDNMGYPNIP